MSRIGKSIGNEVARAEGEEDHGVTAQCIGGPLGEMKMF